MKQKPAPLNNLAVAALSFAISATGQIQLTPAGEFRAIDGRPANCDFWRLDAASAASLIARLESRANDKVIDYQHQTILAAQNGQPAPAAGWMKSFEWRDGEGLFATVEWTDRAKEMIAAGEYKYFSPTIVYDPKTGVVLDILHGALTNFPAIDGMDEVSIAAASAFAALTSTQPETTNMDELLEQLRWLLNLPVGATAEDILAQLTKLSDQVKQATGSTAAASFDLAKHLTDLHGQVTALQAATPDPAKFVPLEQYTALQADLAERTAKLENGERDTLMSAALGDGRILPAQESYWRSQPLAALSAYLAVAQPMAALSGLQSGGAAPAGADGGSVAALSADQQKLCEQMRIPPDEFLATLNGQA